MKYNFMRFPGGLSKAFTLSYDDGLKTDIRFVNKINEYGLKCTFNLTKIHENSQTALTKDEVCELILSKGHEIAVHGYNHRAEGVIRPTEGILDVLNSRIALETTFGIIVRGMAYPDSGIIVLNNGVTVERIKNYLMDADIVYARTLGGDNNSFAIPADWHAWMPTCHHDNEKLFDYLDEFLSIDLSKIYPGRRTAKLFYLWGHSHEFESNNNWQRLDDICEKVSRKDDIWYATNMEIYNYVNSYNSLCYSADSSIVYNPTLVTIWFDVDGKMYEIAPGETICIK